MPVRDEKEKPKPVTVKNVRIVPDKASNAGKTRIDVSCSVFSGNDFTFVKSVELDLTNTVLNRRIELEPVKGRQLPDTAEGDYRCGFEVPLLMDTGLYRIPIEAADNAGGRGVSEFNFDVKFLGPEHSLGLRSDEFAETQAALAKTNWSRASVIEYLDMGDDSLQKRLDMIRGAKKQINIQTYTLSGTGAGSKIIEAVVEKAKQGVEVNVILNEDSQIPTSPMSMFRLKFNQYMDRISKSIMQELEDIPGIEPIQELLNLTRGRNRINVVQFNARRLTEAGVIATSKEKRTAHWLVKLLKEKYKLPDKGLYSTDSIPSFKGPGGLPALPLLDFAVHEKILVVDGEKAMLGGRNLEDKYFTRWLDLDVYVEGEVVNDIQQGFIRSYKRIAESEEDAASPSEIENHLDNAWGASCLFVQSRPWDNDYSVLKTLVNAIRCTKKRFYACSQYLVLPDSLLADAVMDAAKRGVDVRILTNSRRTCKEVNFATGYYMSMDFVQRLQKAGVRIFEVTGKDEELAPQPYFHTKEFIFDDELTAGGSFNLSLRSSFIESENLLFIRDGDICEARQENFREFIKKKAKEVTPPDVELARERYGSRIELARLVELLY